jgi:ComF family protein
LSNIGYRFFDNCLAVTHRLLAPVCALCGDPAAIDGLCGGCRAALPRLPAARCPVCALPNPTSETCGRCLKKRPAFDHVVCALSYEYPANALVLGLKYRGGLAFARPLASCLAEALDAEPYPDIVIPMPLSPGRLVERGFNQAAELARLAASEFGLKISAALVRRNRESAPQASLPWKERAHNVRNAFHCGVNLQGKSVAVVDDVLTTGATLNELALALKRQGARQVTGWMATRTLPQQ